VPFGIVLVIALVHSLRCGPGIAAIICQIYDFSAITVYGCGPVGPSPRPRKKIT
jgi:hypothetical protein